MHCTANELGLRFGRRCRCSASQRSALARDVRAMPIKLISVTKGNSKGAALMNSEWLGKLQRYTTVIEVQVKPNPQRTLLPDKQVEAEGEKVVRHISARDHVILLCERGKEISSEDLANIIASAGDNGVSLVFCIGGPFGHGPAVQRRADQSICLSRLVLNHSIAYVVLMEQLYRAWTILRGEPYHH